MTREWNNRKYSKQKWKELGDQTGRQRFEKKHPWHFTFEGRDAESKAAYAANYDLIDWTNGGGEGNGES